MKLSFTTLGCPDWTLDQIATQGKALGYDGIELRTAPDKRHISPDATNAELAAAARTFAKARIPVMSIMGYCRFAFTDPAEVAANQALMRKLFRVAKALKAPFIRTFAGQIPKGANKDAITEVVANAIAPLAREAADQGITIGLETHDDWCEGKRVLNVVKRVNSKGFGIVYDIFNAFTGGPEPWHVTYESIKKHIVYCHLKDGYRRPDGSHAYVLLGAGDLPIRELLGRFKRDKYKGYFSFEWEKMWHKDLENPERAFPHFPHKVRALWKVA